MNQETPAGQRVPPLPRRAGGKLAGVNADQHDELPAPRLPVRASIYIAPDGTVHFGALFAELVPVAAALSTPTATQTPTATSTPTSTPTATSTATSSPTG